MIGSEAPAFFLLFFAPLSLSLSSTWIISLLNFVCQPKGNPLSKFMELHALLHSPPTIPSSLSPRHFMQGSSLCIVHRQVPKFANLRNYSCSTKLAARQAPGTPRFSSASVKATPQNVNSKQEDLVFVAGATGRVGSRTVRELLKLGLRVRAGVRNAQRAETLAESVRQMMPDAGTNNEETQYVEKLDIVECDLEKRDQIEPALGNASVVICCIGASEKEVFDITGPYRIDYQATKNLIDAANVAKVDHFILLTSLGTSKVGFPAAILNLFWGVLIWKRKAEEALIASGLPYTIVRPGGMERPTDAYKETHNIRLSEEDTLFGGQVSNLQVAELIAFMAKNRSLSYCKVVEVIAETTAPLKPMGELLAKLPSQRAEIFSSKDFDAASKPDPASPKSYVSEDSSSLAEKKPKEDKAMITRPLSPYTAYEDLKPPSSPSPNSPSGPKAVPSITLRIEGTPTPSLEGNGAPDIVDTAAIGNGSRQDLKHYHSPHPVYDDLKPPTSPAPSAPNSSPISTASAALPQMVTRSDGSLHHAAESTGAEIAGNKEHLAESKPRPLSPYTMYEDMKPPSTPMPSPKKH
ncbi:hypothetical protein Ancab_018145 [Ancistrocladus abbreviatus]